MAGLIGVGILIVILVGWYLFDALADKATDELADRIDRATTKKRRTRAPGGSGLVRGRPDDQENPRG